MGACRQARKHSYPTWVTSKEGMPWRGCTKPVRSPTGESFTAWCNHPEQKPVWALHVLSGLGEAMSIPQAVGSTESKGPALGSDRNRVQI